MRNADCGLEAKDLTPSAAQPPFVLNPQSEIRIPQFLKFFRPALLTIKPARAF